MSAEYIAKSLFAQNVAKYELPAMNAVNATWGDGWTSQISFSDSAKIYKCDNNSTKYEMIWNAAYKILRNT